MDKRDPERVLEKLGTLTKDAVAFYRKEQSHELSTRELAEFRRRVRAEFTRMDYGDFRKIMGTAAMRGEVKVDGKDAGSDVMGILFEDDDLRLYKDVIFLVRSLGLPIKDYTVTSMISLRDMIEQKIHSQGWEGIKSDLAESGVSMRDFTHTRYRLRHFLAEGAGPGVAEQILRREELAREPALIDEMNKVFLTPKRKEAVKAELQGARKESGAIWDNIRGQFAGHPDFAGMKPAKMKKELAFGSAGAERFRNQFELLPKQIALLRLNLQEQKELESELKGGQPRPEPIPMDEAHIRASALIRMATQELSEAEAVRNPEKATGLRKRGLQDLAEADSLTIRPKGFNQ